MPLGKEPQPDFIVKYRVMRLTLHCAYDHRHIFRQGRFDGQ